MTATIRSSSTYASAATEASTSGLTLPTGWQPGDVIYIGCELTAATGSITTPSGWTAVVAQFVSAVGSTPTSGHTAVFRRVMQVGDTAPTISFTSGRFAAGLVAIQGADNVTPEDVTPVTDDNTGVTAPSVRAPSITPVSNNCLLLTFHAVRNLTSGVLTSFTPDASETEQTDSGTSVAAVSEAAIEIAFLALSGTSATGTKTATATGSNVTSLNMMGAAIAVRSAATAVATPFAIPAPANPILSDSLSFNPAFAGLRPQTVTSYAGVFTLPATVNVNVSGPSGVVTELIDGVGVASSVSVSAPAGTINIYQTEFQPFPVVPLLPAPFNFAPPYKGLRQQYSTALPDVFVPGSVANVSVSSPSGTVTELIDGVGAVANVNVVANPGSLLITAPNPPNFAFLPLSPFRFVPSLTGLRVQHNTGTPISLGGVSGPVANVNVSGQADNSVTVTTLGAASNVTVAGIAGTVTESVIGSVSLVAVSAISGSILSSLSGTTGLVNVVAPPGTASSSGGGGNINISGLAATIFVMAPSGTVTLEPVGTWWRVYPAYRSYPT